MTNRNKTVGQNGNDGEIYLVEAVAGIIAEDDWEWEFYIDKAMEIIEIVRIWDEN